YLLGMPHHTPMLGWQAAALFGIGCALAMLGGQILAMRGGQEFHSGLPRITRVSAYALAFLYFISANYVPRSPRLERAIVSVDRQTGAIRWISGGLVAP